MEKKNINRYLAPLIVICLVVVLFIIRALPGDHFRPGADRNARQAFEKTNIVNLQEILSLKKEPVVLLLNINYVPGVLDQFAKEKIEPSELGEKRTIARLKKTGKPLVIVADKNSIAARAWMLLSQSGLKEIYLFSAEPGTEQFKYRFDPDTTVITGEQEKE